MQTFFQYFPVGERERKWGLHVLTVGESQLPPRSPYPPAGHPKGYAFDWAHGRVLHQFQAVYISGGRGWFENAQGRRRRIESGTLFLLFPGVWHRYMPDAETGWHEHWVGFDGAMPRQWAKCGFIQPQKPILTPNSERTMRETFGSLLDTARQQEPASQQLMAGLTAYLLAQIYSAQQGGGKRDGAVASAIQEAIQTMNATTREPIAPAALARKMHVSYTWFRRSFVQHTGLSPHQYHLQLRLAQARHLLVATTLTIKQIAAETGFSDEQYFCRLFKKKNGLSPGFWRARSQRR